MQLSDPDALRLEPFLGVPWGPEWGAEAVIATLEPLVLEERRARIAEVTDARIGSVTVLMDAPNDPHNGAAVMRTADALGVQIVHVVPRAEGFYVSGGVAKGTQRWIDVVLHDGPEAAVASLREQGFELVATHPQGELVPEDLATIPKLALVLGNEHDGIRRALTEAADRSVRIPMRGFVESLNVSVAAAVLLSAATRARPGDLPTAGRRLLYARGLYRTVARAAEVLDASEPR